MYGSILFVVECEWVVGSDSTLVGSTLLPLLPVNVVLLFKLLHFNQTILSGQFIITYHSFLAFLH